MTATFGVIPEFKSLTIESEPRPANWPRSVFLLDDSSTVTGWVESHVITTLTARDGRRYVGTDMTAEEISEWEALLSGKGEP